jgi:hypothetical protein
VPRQCVGSRRTTRRLGGSVSLLDLIEELATRPSVPTLSLARYIASRPIPRHRSPCLAHSVDRAGIIPTCAIPYGRAAEACEVRTASRGGF